MLGCKDESYFLAKFYLNPLSGLWLYVTYGLTDKGTFITLVVKHT